MGNFPYNDHLISVVYDQLKGIAHGYMGKERKPHVLQPTALVHETYLKMVRSASPQWSSQTQFVGCAAYVMRQVLIDFARQTEAAKRKGEQVNWTISSLASPEPMTLEDFLGLDRALTRLSKRKPHGSRQTRLIELVWLGGMSMTEAAAEIGISRRQAHRDWAFSRIWLEKDISGV